MKEIFPSLFPKFCIAAFIVNVLSAAAAPNARLLMSFDSAVFDSIFYLFSNLHDYFFSKVFHLRSVGGFVFRRQLVNWDRTPLKTQGVQRVMQT